MVKLKELQQGMAAATGSLLALAMLTQLTPVPAGKTAPAEPGISSQPLPSWREGPTKARILAFVASVSREGSEGYVPPAERIAVFDNDGTLWSEQPMYVQLAFAIERARALVAQQPELASNPVLAAASAAGNGEAVLTMGTKGLLDLVALTHAGMSTEVFRDLVREWLDGACHPTLKRPYTSLTYQPMRELLDYLRANGFRTYIVSGGGVEFMRVFSEELYGIPPEQVIGSTVGSRYSNRAGLPVILRKPEVQVINDHAIKPVMIEQVIGRRPVAAFGNSDGDFEMLEWTTSQPGERLGVIIHHDDPEREVAYDSQSSFGRLDRGLREASRRGWSLVSMRDDWAQVFATPPASTGSDGAGGANRCERGAGQLPEQPAVIPGEVPRIEEAPAGRQP
ncbi:haloacid dehalogenase-like hydrolase [Synechococcus sp. Cruz-9H2]|uniref:HAD family hydrolase n=1 Tax=unclassified Synechococcus TaxID=2626047 RepID=UPI0020CF751E|nr:MULTISPECIES: HAD family hydrolase [unclassified Synechococcus]MCP9819813.1 haloacid dehalogenase-like hydrolase [Synechococcus sp. Cruz-9H2]MCP9844121.1 haloacid dehalogenase-like hydrolase [Synechococcus sp. Edmonson 11F2]MCP9856243.1 haloacid dehalogenase-like hydrolase [Synechococcus sp. Cruz-9C9]MCP9863528.1 haloacid dehalogenase-like hydrolase [Synechococcus sp. Cruz-7E5]MCP9870724.1 haloacid dehalogenase-like hydrolase [Synechococcus sp. Cruz-7B9]